MKSRPLFIYVILFCSLSFSCGSQPGKEKPQQNAKKSAASEEGTFCFKRKSELTKPAPGNSPGCIKVVEGEIKGLVTQKGKISESLSEKDPSKKVYSVSYHLVNGHEIAAIDENGIHKESSMVVFFSVTQEGSPPDDNEVVETALNTPEGMPFYVGYTASGASVIRVSGRSKDKTSTSTDTILGEVQKDPATDKFRIAPAIQAKTDQGKISIPVKNFVRFKEKSDQTSPGNEQ